MVQHYGKQLYEPGSAEWAERTVVLSLHVNPGAIQAPELAKLFNKTSRCKAVCNVVEVSPQEVAATVIAPVRTAHESPPAVPVVSVLFMTFFSPTGRRHVLDFVRDDSTIGQPPILDMAAIFSLIYSIHPEKNDLYQHRYLQAKILAEGAVPCLGYGADFLPPNHLWVLAPTSLCPQVQSGFLTAAEIRGKAVEHSAQLRPESIPTELKRIADDLALREKHWLKVGGKLTVVACVKGPGHLDRLQLPGLTTYRREQLRDTRRELSALLTRMLDYGRLDRAYRDQVKESLKVESILALQEAGPLPESLLQQLEQLNLQLTKLRQTANRLLRPTRRVFEDYSKPSNSFDQQLDETPKASANGEALMASSGSTLDLSGPALLKDPSPEMAAISGSHNHDSPTTSHASGRDEHSASPAASTLRLPDFALPRTAVQGEGKACTSDHHLALVREDQVESTDSQVNVAYDQSRGVGGAEQACSVTVGHTPSSLAQAPSGSVVFSSRPLVARTPPRPPAPLVKDSDPEMTIAAACSRPLVARTPPRPPAPMVKDSGTRMTIAAASRMDMDPAIDAAANALSGGISARSEPPGTPAALAATVEEGATHPCVAPAVHAEHKTCLPGAQAATESLSAGASAGAAQLLVPPKPKPAARPTNKRRYLRSFGALERSPPPTSSGDADRDAVSTAALTARLGLADINDPGNAGQASPTGPHEEIAGPPGPKRRKPNPYMEPSTTYRGYYEKK